MAKPVEVEEYGKQVNRVVSKLDARVSELEKALPKGKSAVEEEDSA